MTKDERNKILKENEGTLYSKAVKELIIEKIVEFESGEIAKDWEDYLGKMKAVLVLKKIFKGLKILKNDIKASNRSEYE